MCTADNGAKRVPRRSTVLQLPNCSASLMQPKPPACHCSNCSVWQMHKMVMMPDVHQHSVCDQQRGSARVLPHFQHLCPRPQQDLNETSASTGVNVMNAACTMASNWYTIPAAPRVLYVRTPSQAQQHAMFSTRTAAAAAFTPDWQHNAPSVTNPAHHHPHLSMLTTTS